MTWYAPVPIRHGSPPLAFPIGERKEGERNFGNSIFLSTISLLFGFGVWEYY